MPKNIELIQQKSILSPISISEVLFLSSWATYPFKLEVVEGNEYHGSVGEVGVETSENQTQVMERIIAQIKLFADQTASIHQAATMSEDGNIQPGKENHVTRLLTNEFFFFTKHPLNLGEFQSLLTQIISLAKMQSANIHWVLGSFAVLTSNNAVMNVVAHIQCGEQFKLDLIVKNNASDTDPVYKQETDGEIKVLRNAEISHYLEEVLNSSVTLFDVQYSFSYHNIVLCQTSGGASFYSCVDICIDHLEKVGRNNMLTLLRAELDVGKIVVSDCVHSVISNSILPRTECSIGGVTYVDPGAVIIHSAECNPSTQVMRLPDDQVKFGKYATRVVLASKPTYVMREELTKIAGEDGKYIPACLSWACRVGSHESAKTIIEASSEWKMMCAEIEDKQNQQWSFIESLFSKLSCEQISLDFLLEQEAHFEMACDYWKDGYEISINRLIKMITWQVNNQSTDIHFSSRFENIREMLALARDDLVYAWDKWFLTKTEFMCGNEKIQNSPIRNTGMTLFAEVKSHSRFTICKELKVSDLPRPIHTIAR